MDNGQSNDCSKQLKPEMIKKNLKHFSMQQWKNNEWKICNLVIMRNKDSSGELDNTEISWCLCKTQWMMIV